MIYQTLIKKVNNKKTFRDLSSGFDVCVIGQIVKDYNYLKGKKYPPKLSAGGTGYYSTYTYYNLGLKTAVVTSFNKNR